MFKRDCNLLHFAKECDDIWSVKSVRSGEMYFKSSHKLLVPGKNISFGIVHIYLVNIKRESVRMCILYLLFWSAGTYNSILQ